MISARRVGGSSDLAKKIFSRIESVSAKIGWFDSENASKAYINEKGGISSDGEHEIPPRPFISPAIFKVSETKVASSFFRRTITPSDVDEAYENVANALKEEIQKSIDDLKSPKLAKKTIAERLKKGQGHYVAGLEKPLIETGEMRDSIQVKLEEKNAEL